MKDSEARLKLMAEVSKLWPAAKGSVRKYNRKCTKKKKECEKCLSGEGHPVWELTYYKDGKQKSKHVRTSDIDAVKQALENGRKIEELLVDAGLAYMDELKNM